MSSTEESVPTKVEFKKKVRKPLRKRKPSDDESDEDNSLR